MRTQVVAIGGGPAGLLLFRFPEQSPIDLRMQQAGFEYLESPVAAQTSLAEIYVGLPY